MREPLPVIGRVEWVSFPDWEVGRLRAKVDTGARTSALHVENVEELSRGRVRFDVILDRRRSHRRVHVTTHVRRRARVRSSNGQFEERIFVATTLRMGRYRFPIELSLVDRGDMLHRMLLGRNALEGRFWVDVSRRGVVSARRRPHSEARPH